MPVSAAYIKADIKTYAAFFCKPILGREQGKKEIMYMLVAPLAARWIL
jgi:hypothetical protein